MDAASINWRRGPRLQRQVHAEDGAGDCDRDEGARVSLASATPFGLIIIIIIIIIVVVVIIWNTTRRSSFANFARKSHCLPRLPRLPRLPLSAFVSQPEPANFTMDDRADWAKVFECTAAQVGASIASPVFVGAFVWIRQVVSRKGRRRRRSGVIASSFICLSL